MSLVNSGNNIKMRYTINKAEQESWAELYKLIIHEAIFVSDNKAYNNKSLAIDGLSILFPSNL